MSRNYNITFEPTLKDIVAIRPAVSGDLTTSVTFKATLSSSELNRLAGSLDLWTNISTDKNRLDQWRAVPFEESVSERDSLDEKRVLYASVQMACPITSPSVQFGYTFRVKKPSKTDWLGKDTTNGQLVVRPPPFWDNRVRNGTILGELQPNDRWRAWCFSPNQAPRVIEQNSSHLPHLTAQTVLLVPHARTIAHQPLLLFYSPKLPIEVSSNRVTCATPDVVQVHANPEHSVVPSLLRGVPDLSIITSSNPSYIYTYTASLHTSDSASFVFPPLTLAISSSSGTNAEPIFVQTNDFLQLLAQFSNTLSTATPLVIHQLSRIPTLLSQRRRDDPETMYSVIPNEPIRVVRLYSLPSRDMDVGTSLNQLVGLVSPGHAVMSTSTTKMTPTATGMGVRRRGTRQEIEKLNGNSGRSSSDATTLVNGESREGEGGRNATEAPSAIFTLSKSKSTSMNGDRGVLFRRKIPVPFGGSKGLMVRTTLLISSLVVYVVSLIFGLLGLSLHLEWAERKGAITHGDEAKNTVDSDASNTESTPRRPTISSLPSPSPPVASVPSSPPILSKFLLTPAELNPGDQRTSTQIHLLYKGTDPNSLQFFLDGRRLEPRSIVHTSFEYVTQSQSQTFGQESQLSDKGDDFHEFVVRVDKFENVAGWSGRGRGSHSLEVVSSI